MKKIEQIAIKVLIYGLACWLLIEWLLPLETISDTSNVEVFVWFVALCFQLYFLRLPFWLSAFVKSIYMLWSLNHWFYHASIFSVPTRIWQEIADHTAILFTPRLIELSDSLRSFLFFGLLWLVAYVWHHWIVVRKRLFFFYVLTVIYVTVLDTFTMFRGNGAIVRLVAFGFFFLSLLHIERLREQSPMTAGMRRWWGACLSFIGLAVLVGYFSPKLPPQWPDPVAFVKSYAAAPEEKRVDPAAAKVKKVGYGQNDSRLGGPFIGDDTVVFTADDESRHYWRVETKDIYTGKGWESFQSGQLLSFGNDMDIRYSWWSPSVKRQRVTASVYMREPSFHLVYPLGLKKVKTREDVVYRMEAATEKIYTTDRSAYTLPLTSYHFVYEYPTFSIEALKVAPPVEDAKLLERYTQLPESLPKRVRDLAKKITNGKQTQYEQVKAVEQYFHSNGYTYETTNVAVPGKNEDYVDQFLFETKKGYCDNFSTSMVVMLRSLGIPARWVKGYTSGRLIEEKDGKNIYEITNNDAHSWVEVYFSGIGWVPFEPTQGFANPYVFTASSRDSETAPLSERRTPEQNRVPLDRIREQPYSSPAQGHGEQSRLLPSWSWKRIAIVLAVFFVFVWTAYKIRRKWWPYVTILRFQYKRKKGDNSFAAAYLSLLRHLDDYGLKRKPHQTLRQYAAYVDDWFETKEMTKLTVLYEKSVYLSKNNLVDWDEVRELWENLIKKTVS
jgi:transglutaminase-like putative cysteine protease